MTESFYIYETHYVSKCKRCKNSEPLEDHEICEPCIHAMITPGYSGPVQIPVEDLPF